MANTRLTQTIRNEISEAIDTLLLAPVRFIDLPAPLATRQKRKELWERLFPAEFIESKEQLNKLGYSIAATNWAEIPVLLAGAPVRLTLGAEMDMSLDLPFGAGLYVSASPKIEDEHWGEDFRVDLSTLLGPDWPEVRDWMLLTKADADSAQEAKTIVNDIMRMALTAGQLKRMVPDLLKYLPDDKRRMLQDQVRASTVPFEWTAYDRNRVERAITYISKCHMLTGIGKPHRQKLTRDVHTTWCVPPKNEG